ncbi:TetR/AcrR family transcriptional regulator [Lachnospiraceae bacterium MD1]|uniref:TetR/AcrR family transcriptional regulator n=2 Tax=Variimorphobacter saccharofermentans TaxID=2755051 RepID=A0A839K337_9FIRM|nr:TetR/AcrR family transcriptional regulator [Variimorphobacter saccharofermentans]
MIMNQRDKIITVTTELIIESQGDLSQVTARKIANKAEVGLGLIHYHFESKDQLITECVQRIIYKEIRSFVPQNTEYSDNPIEADKQRLTYWAKQVFEFFYANKSISRVSILGDLRNNLTSSNSVDMQRGLLRALTSDIDDAKKKFMIFSLTSIMQAAFLQDNAVKNRLGFDFTKQNDRELFINSVIEELFHFTQT